MAEEAGLEKPAPQFGEGGRSAEPTSWAVGQLGWRPHTRSWDRAPLLGAKPPVLTSQTVPRASLVYRLDHLVNRMRRSISSSGGSDVSHSASRLVGDRHELVS